MDHYKDFFETLENETEDDLNKWRNLCYTSIVREKMIKYQSSIKLSNLQSKANQLDHDLNNVLQNLAEMQSKKLEEQEKLDEIKKLEEMFMNNSNKNNYVSAMCFLNQYKNTKSRASQEKMKHVITKMSSYSSLLDGIDAKIQSIHLKISKLSNTIEKRKKIINEKNAQLNVLKKIEIPSEPGELFSIRQEGVTVESAKKAILTWNNEIREFIKNIDEYGSVEHEDRNIQIAALQENIENETERHEQLLAKIQKDYDTSAIQTEIDRLNAKVEPLRKLVFEKQHESEKTITAIESERTQAIEILTQQISTNDDKIKNLEATLADLQKHVSHSTNKKTTTSTNTVASSIFL